MDKLKELQEIIDQSQQLFFSVGQASQQSPISLIFGALMVFIASPWGAILTAGATGLSYHV